MSIRTLRDKLVRRFPKAVVQLDEAATATGASLLDVRANGHSVTIEWRKRDGFGVSSRPDVAYGEGVDETYESEEDAFKRVVALLLSRTKTSLPPNVRLRDLRESMGISQTQLAKRMRIQQASVSKIEQGRDMRVSTLRSLVAALGGELAITARFPDGNERRLDLRALMSAK